MTKNREAGLAKSALNEAKHAAQQITTDKDKSDLLVVVAKWLAKLHYYRLARETAIVFKKKKSTADCPVCGGFLYSELVEGRAPPIRDPGFL